MPQHLLTLLTAQVLAFAAEEPDDIVSVPFEQRIRRLRSRSCGQGEHQVVLSRELVCVARSSPPTSDRRDCGTALSAAAASPRILLPGERVVDRAPART